MAGKESRDPGAATAPSEDGELIDVEEDSWLERLGDSIGAIIFGALLIVGTCTLLFWNESDVVKTARMLAAGSPLVRAIPADRIDPSNEGKLVHVVGMLSAGGPAADLEFGVKSPGVRLKRTVEMFQWVEESMTETVSKPDGEQGARTTYKYVQAWLDHPVDSDEFDEWRGHANPEMIYRTHLILAPQPKLGAFILPPNLLYRFGKEVPLKVDPRQAAALQKRLDRPVHVVDGALYVGSDPSHPDVGDLRVSFTHVPLQTASVVAEQAGSTFDFYHPESGGPIELMVPGTKVPASLFKRVEVSRPLWPWLIRSGCCVLMFFGFVLVMGPLSALADIVPLLREISDASVGLLALLFSAVLAPVTIAIAWFGYRPLVGGEVLAAGAVLAAIAAWLAHRHVLRKTAAPA